MTIGRPSFPNYIPPIHLPDPRDVAKRIASEAMPVLHAASALAKAGSPIARGAGEFALGAAEVASNVSTASDALRDMAADGRRVEGAARAMAGAAAHSRIAGQIGYDLARVRVAVSQAEEAARVFKSDAAASVLTFMRPELQRLQGAFESERNFQRQYGELASKLRNLKGSGKAGEIALAAERIASKSAMGRSILDGGRALGTGKIGALLTMVGIGTAMAKGYGEAPTKSSLWKTGYGATAVASSMLVEHGMKGLNPAAALYDPVAKAATSALGLKNVDVTIGSFYDDCTKHIFAITQAVTTGDTAPMNRVHEELMAGNGSTILKGYAAMGDAIGQTALVDTGMTKLADWWNNVPADFRTSPSWWEAAQSDSRSLMDAGRGMMMMVRGQ